MNINKKTSKMWKILLDVLFPIHQNQAFLNNLTTEKFISLTNPAKIPPIPNTISIVSYRNRFVKKTLWSLKFKNNHQIAKLFAEVIYDNLIEELSNLKLTANFDNPILVVIPLSRQRKRTRGYNQVDLIARAIEELDQNNFLEYRRNILKKVKDTPQQSRAKNKQERLKNLKNCFKVTNFETIRNRNIILLDDITTTGATLIEATQTLKSAKPKQILCVTLAH
ncbi:MAG: phosphoribosyltransferase family protein [Patescibacteria group bacterium]|nr:phosphoribosyltransferase family protein [Patescibacteria group bacterium]